MIASNALLLLFSSAVSELANHETSIREQMKAVRTREENLDALKRRRRSLISDAEAADRKLNKMAPENKNLVQQTEHVNRLREEIRQMDSEIMAEEANLGDFKRATVRQWMGTKFGSLMECCEKGTVRLASLICTCDGVRMSICVDCGRARKACHLGTSIIVV